MVYFSSILHSPALPPSAPYSPYSFHYPLTFSSFFLRLDPFFHLPSYYNSPSSHSSSSLLYIWIQSPPSSVLCRSGISFSSKGFIPFYFFEMLILRTLIIKGIQYLTPIEQREIPNPTPRTRIKLHYLISDVPKININSNFSIRNSLLEVRYKRLTSYSLPYLHPLQMALKCRDEDDKLFLVALTTNALVCFTQAPSLSCTSARVVRFSLL